MQSNCSARRSLTNCGFVLSSGSNVDLYALSLFWHYSTHEPQQGRCHGDTKVNSEFVFLSQGWRDREHSTVRDLRQAGGDWGRQSSGTVTMATTQPHWWRPSDLIRRLLIGSTDGVLPVEMSSRCLRNKQWKQNELFLNVLSQQKLYVTIY